MRLLILFISVVVLGVTGIQASSNTVSKKILRHTERVKTTPSSFNNQGIPLKTDRLSNNEGNIVMTYDESLADSIKTSLLAAEKLWEALIPTKQPIFINVVFESLGDDISMIADVIYCETVLEGCPSALASQVRNSPFGSVVSPDGYIVLNSDIDWNCNFSKEYASEYNLPTMVLRGIARCLGFGSSMTEYSEDQFFYRFDIPTYFDKLLYNNDKALCDIPTGSLDMANFVKSDNVYAHTTSQSHKIYAPEVFVQDLSLCYFDDQNSIMSYHIGQGNIDLSIDKNTCDILRTIGWDLPQSGFSIKCDNISDNGIGSSYDTHVFSLLNETGNVSNHHWRFLLKSKLGDYTEVSSGTSDTFTIPQISSPDQFYVNVNGDLEGRIECDYTLNGVQYYATPFTLSLELKPIIRSIDDISIVNNSEYEFALNFNVHYTGADYVSVEIEEEYNTTLRNYRFDEPYIAHVKTGNITNLYYSWITIIVSNKYGTVFETLEYAPTFGARACSTPSNVELSSPTVNEIRLYNIDGCPVFKGTLPEFMNQAFNPGMYIKEEILDDGTSNISKILFK